MDIENPAGDTILAVDFGTATTRALLLDVVETGYRLVGFGEAPSTIDPPYGDASEGMRHALFELQNITGRMLLDDSARLIMPASSDGRGTDTFVATSSAGPAVRTVLVGLLPDVSLASARRVAASSYLNVLDTFSLGDKRGEDEQIDAVLAARPELILIAGGTDGGASEALLKLVETVALACHLLPPEVHSRALFMGNSELAPRLQELLGKVARVHTAPNAQPQLGLERLGPARAELGNVYEDLRRETIGGYGDLGQWAGGQIVPTAQAAGTFARFLSKLPAYPRGVLHVDAGSASAFVAAAWQGQLQLAVQTNLGLGVSAASTLQRPEAEAALAYLARWVPREISSDALREFLLNKSLYPHTLPSDKDDLELEHALARLVLRTALRRARPDWPEDVPGPRAEGLPWFSLILGSGAVLGQAPRPGLAALLLLDALQPSGVTRLMLDPYHLAAALGALARHHPVAVAQVFDSLAFVELGTAISLLGGGPLARAGDVVLSARLVEEGGGEQEVEVRAGALEVLKLGPGRTGKLTVRPRPTINAGFGLGRGRSITIKGGAVGVIIDARGRPLALPKPAEKRYEAVQAWHARLGGA
jgi:hypothetical protein